MIKKIDHVVITTAQLEICLTFYKTLGFRIEEDFGCYVAYAGNFKINIHSIGNERLPHASHIQSGSGDFCFEISGSLEKLYQEYMQKGVKMESHIVTRHGVKGEMHSFYVRDPDGTLLEFCSYANNI